MKITNNNNLPEALVAAIRNDPYNRGRSDITVTQLISPPRIVLLNEMYDDQIEEDASDRIWSLFGSAVHAILEQSGTESEIVEKRIYIEEHGWTVGGQLDNLSIRDGVLSDYKVTSVFAVKDGGKDEWEAQLNVLAYMLSRQEEPIVVFKLQIVAILRDWRMAEALRDPDYPQSNVVVLDIPMWSSGAQEEYIHERVMLHQGCRVLADTGAINEVPECSEEERWEKPTKWAVMKKGARRATKLHNSEEGAKKHLDSLDRNYYIEFRPGERTRCERYCGASIFCNHFQKYKENQNG